MHVKGLMNMQYAIEDGKVYVLEANPRASRTVPLVSKVCNVRMVPLATQIITSELTGKPSPVPELKEQAIPYYGVKEDLSYAKSRKESCCSGFWCNNEYIT